MTSYRVLANTKLVDFRDRPGWRIVGCAPFDRRNYEMLTVEDDSAPADLEGRVVDVTFGVTTETGEITVASRRVVS